MARKYLRTLRKNMTKGHSTLEIRLSQDETRKYLLEEKNIMN